jgi:hypothetical protein
MISKPPSDPPTLPLGQVRRHQVVRGLHHRSASLYEEVELYRKSRPSNIGRCQQGLPKEVAGILSPNDTAVKLYDMLTGCQVYSIIAILV